MKFAVVVTMPAVGDVDEGVKPLELVAEEAHAIARTPATLPPPIPFRRAYRW